MNSDSVAGSCASVNDRSMVFVARPDSPTPVSASPRVCFGRALPIMKATATNAIQPTIAVHGCRPLQRPIRCARLRLVCIDQTPGGEKGFERVLLQPAPPGACREGG
jgi:hypothetical protein